MNKRSKKLNNSVGNLLEEIKEQDINLDKYGATGNLTVQPSLTTITNYGKPISIAAEYYLSSKLC